MRYDDSLVKEPPAEDTPSYASLVESFARSVATTEGMDADVKQRLQAASGIHCRGTAATLRG